MNTLRKYFGQFTMTWSRVVFLAIITAIYTALINQVPFLKDTSFQDIAIYLDWWILFALFIILNCQKWWEAAIKCFVFFIISQPLIYLIEVPFYNQGWQIFRYYDYWFKITLLTIPGSIVAFQVKRKNWLSVIILSVPIVHLSYASISYFQTAVSNFPHHLLSALFAISLAIFFIVVLLDQKKHRLVSLCVLIVSVVSFGILTAPEKTIDIQLEQAYTSFYVEDASIIQVEEKNDQQVKVIAQHDGGTLVHFINKDGSETLYYVTVSSGSIWVNVLE